MAYKPLKSGVEKELMKQLKERRRMSITIISCSRIGFERVLINSDVLLKFSCQIIFSKRPGLIVIEIVENYS
jgi:hypothetical protein